jgi:hypothetical protein
MMVLSPQICYVCGGPGAVLNLHTKPTSKDAYFPFLGTHEQPNGARPPSKDGLVDCCNICYAFLQQQWESYERTHTPLVKRLYWLKRIDNRPFTGNCDFYLNLELKLSKEKNPKNLLCNKVIKF